MRYDRSFHLSRRRGPRPDRPNEGPRREPLERFPSWSDRFALHGPGYRGPGEAGRYGDAPVPYGPDHTYDYHLGDRYGTGPDYWVGDRRVRRGERRPRPRRRRPRA